ncbi:HSP20-like chaperone [Tribonema minus]|uniref:HSP20-like chaperone n=1 Tax=Tribonema minus TaxID=303371 RepID=A0A835Z9D8_9STRA|nr:HSP20-like chaperone [Tribonema minus]
MLAPTRYLVFRAVPARLSANGLRPSFNLTRTLSSEAEGEGSSGTIKAEHVSGGGTAQDTQQSRRRRGMRSVTPGSAGATPSASLSPTQRGTSVRRLAQPARDLQDLRRGFDDLFRSFEQDFFGSPSPFPSVFGSPLAGFTPSTILSMPAPPALPAMSMDVRATDGAYNISVELPGLDKKDLRIEVDDERNALTLTATHEEKPADTSSEEEEEEEPGYLLRERSYGRVTRSVFLPDDADMKKIQEAELKDGVLHVMVPKKEEAQTTRPLEIK